MKALVIFVSDNPKKIEEIYWKVNYCDKGSFVAWKDFRTITSARAFLAEDVRYSPNFYHNNYNLILNGKKDDFTYNGVTIGIKINDDRRKWLAYTRKFK